MTYLALGKGKGKKKKKENRHGLGQPQLLPTNMRRVARTVLEFRLVMPQAKAISPNGMHQSPVFAGLPATAYGRLLVGLG